MKLDREPFRDWFGFTRRERSSTIILLLIIVLIISFREIVPDKNIDIKDISDSFSGSDSSIPDFSGTISSPEKDFRPGPRLAAHGPVNSLHYRKKGEKISQTEKSKIVQDKQLTDINKCDSASLVALPGIGPVLAARIIKYRKLLGGFANTAQLKEVYGLPEETYNLIKNDVTADTSAIARIKINSADFRQLLRFPYFEKNEVTNILNYRRVKGRIDSLTELVDNKYITNEKAMQVSPYISFE